MDFAKLTGQLMRHEGFKLKPYTDTVGKLTIGVGHNLTDKGLTKAQAMSILMDDIAETVQWLTYKLPWWTSLDDVRQRALVDLAFNMGGTLLEFKNTLAALEHQEWDKAADNLLHSKYATQVGQRAKTIAHMIRTGTDL